MQSGDQEPSPLNYVQVTEQKRLNEAREQGIPWKKWGPYLSERQWGTVREDYSRTAMRGTTFPTTSRVPAPTTGEKTGWPESPTTSSSFASRWRCGMGAIPS